MKRNQSKLVRSVVVGAAVTAILTAAQQVRSGSVMLPFTFANGQPADADEVNANFDAVATAINDNDARLASLENGGMPVAPIVLDSLDQFVGVYTTGYVLRDIGGKVVAFVMNKDGIIPEGCRCYFAGTACSGAKYVASSTGLADDAQVCGTKIYVGNGARAVVGLQSVGNCDGSDCFAAVGSDFMEPAIGLDTATIGLPPFRLVMR